MTKLEEGKSITRVVHIHLIGDVAVTIDGVGLTLRIPGTQKKIEAPWGTVIKSMPTPPSVPSYLAGKTYEFLQHQAEKVAKTREKKAAAKAA